MASNHFYRLTPQLLTKLILTHRERCFKCGLDLCIGDAMASVCARTGRRLYHAKCYNSLFIDVDRLKQKAQDLEQADHGLHFSSPAAAKPKTKIHYIYFRIYDVFLQNPTRRFSYQEFIDFFSEIFYRKYQIGASERTIRSYIILLTQRGKLDRYKDPASGKAYFCLRQTD